MIWHYLGASQYDAKTKICSIHNERLHTLLDSIGTQVIQLICVSFFHGKHWDKRVWVLHFSEWKLVLWNSRLWALFFLKYSISKISRSYAGIISDHMLENFISYSLANLYIITWKSILCTRTGVRMYDMISICSVSSKIITGGCHI